MNGELERLLANLIRVGRVKEVDHASARVRLEIGGLTTDWLPWGEGRAGKTRTWSAPTVGEQRLILSPYGDMTQGVVCGAIFQDDHAAPATSGDKEVTVFPDGTTFEYDSAANTYTQTVAGSGKWVFNLKEATINAATSVTLNTPDTFCKGKLTVDGLLTYKGGLTGSGGSGASLSGDFKAQGGAFSHNGKNVGSDHTHTGVQPGGGTSSVPS